MGLKACEWEWELLLNDSTHTAMNTISHTHTLSLSHTQTCFCLNKGIDNSRYFIISRNFLNANILFLKHKYLAYTSILLTCGCTSSKCITVDYGKKRYLTKRKELKR